MDPAQLASTALQDGLAAAKGHRKELGAFVAAHAQLIADGTAKLLDERARGIIDDDDVRFGFERIRKSQKTALRAVNATAKAAAQDAINAMLGVAMGAVNKAIGIPLL